MFKIISMIISSLMGGLALCFFAEHFFTHYEIAKIIFLPIFGFFQSVIFFSK